MKHRQFDDNPLVEVDKPISDRSVQTDALSEKVVRALRRRQRETKSSRRK